MVKTTFFFFNLFLLPEAFILQSYVRFGHGPFELQLTDDSSFKCWIKDQLSRVRDSSGLESHHLCLAFQKYFINGHNRFCPTPPLSLRDWLQGQPCPHRTVSLPDDSQPQLPAFQAMWLVRELKSSEELV